MNRRDIGNVLIGFGVGIATVSALTSVYCLYFRKSLRFKPKNDDKCNNCPNLPEN